MRNLLLCSLFVLTVLCLLELQTRAFGQDHPDPHETGCLAGCVVDVIDFDEADVGDVTEKGEYGNRGSTRGTGGASSTGGWGKSDPGGTASEPGVEPQRSSGPLPLIILGSLIPRGGGPARAPLDPYALQPPREPFTPPSLWRLPLPPTPSPSISAFQGIPALYSKWDRAALGDYVDTSVQASEKAVVWGVNTGNVEKAATVSTNVLGSSSSLTAARTGVPSRIAQGQRSLFTSPPPLYLPSDGAVVSTADSGSVSTTDEKDDEVSEEAYEFSKEAIEISTEHAVSSIDRGINQMRQNLSKNTISQNQFNKYLSEAKDTKSIVSGLGKLITAADYAVAVKKALEADPGKNTQYQAGQVAYKFATDLAGKASQKGIAAAAKAVFPEIAEYIVEGAEIGFVVIPITFGSEEIGKDPSEIVMDKTGKYSLEEKKKAFGQQLKWYDRHKGPNEALTDDLLKQLQTISEEENTAHPK